TSATRTATTRRATPRASPTSAGRSRTRASCQSRRSSTCRPSSTRPRSAKRRWRSASSCSTSATRCASTASASARGCASSCGTPRRAGSRSASPPPETSHERRALPQEGSELRARAGPPLPRRHARRRREARLPDPLGAGGRRRRVPRVLGREQARQEAEHAGRARPGHRGRARGPRADRGRARRPGRGDGDAAARRLPRPRARVVGAADAMTKGKPQPTSRAKGRPPKGAAPALPAEEVDRLLVFGEVVTCDDGSSQTVTYPSYRDLAERFGVSTTLIAKYSKDHNCIRRREQAKARIQAQADQKLVELRATAVALSKDDELRIIDTYLAGFEKALAEGRVRFDNPGDFNTMVRLKEFVMG